MNLSKIVILYDSKTGNTEKIAKFIAEGASSVSGVDVLLKKIGDVFTFRVLDNVDALLFGSPAHYAHATSDMRDFVACLRGNIAEGRLYLQGKLAAVFGTYGWDGGIAIERLATAIEQLGFALHSPILAKSSSGFPSTDNELKKECTQYGKSVAIKALETKT